MKWEKKLVVTENFWYLSIVKIKETKIDGLLDWTESSMNVFRGDCRKPLKFKIKIMNRAHLWYLHCIGWTSSSNWFLAKETHGSAHHNCSKRMIHFTKGECSEMKVEYGFEYVRATSVGSRWRIGMQVHDRGTNSMMWHWVMCVSNEKEIDKKFVVFPFWRCLLSW